MFKRESKQILKTVCATVLSLAIALVETASVQAAPAAHMKKLNVKWDLKPGKTVTFKTKWAGVGMKKSKAIIKNYKVSDAKEGYKKLKFTIIFKRTYTPSKKEVHKIFQAKKNNLLTGDMYLAVVDYRTGKDLEAKNDVNVDVTYGDWKSSNEKHYDDEDGCGIWEYKTAKSNVTITYPDTYKNLCIAVGGRTAIKYTAQDKKWGEGKTTFSKTSFYSKADKSVCHCMRVQ